MLVMAIGMILVVSLVAGVVVLVPRVLGEARVSWIAPPRPTASPTVDPVTALRGLTPSTVTFTDAQHGYLLMLRCDSGDIRQCTYELFATDDGGPATQINRPLLASDGRGTFYTSADGEHWDEVRLS